MDDLRLGRLDRDLLHETFQEAFADYAVPLSHITPEMKAVRALKNRVDWPVSVGVFNGPRMVAFTLIGVDRWKGRLTAFDAATGVVPDHRGKGLAARMLDHALPTLRDRGVDYFALEVLQSNTAAIRAYRKAGFAVTRELSCYELPTTGVAAADPQVRRGSRQEMLALASHHDWHPSWENGPGAVEQIPDPLQILAVEREGHCVGALAYTPLLNGILDLVVHREHRRQGIATALIDALRAGLAGSPPAARLLNVDRGDGGMLAFVERTGFRHTVDQFEMERSLQ